MTSQPVSRPEAMRTCEEHPDTSAEEVQPECPQQMRFTASCEFRALTGPLILQGKAPGLVNHNLGVRCQPLDVHAQLFVLQPLDTVCIRSLSAKASSKHRQYSRHKS